MIAEDLVELLPCPFCGGRADIVGLGSSRRSTVYGCTECGCQMETGETYGHGEDWNRRAPDPRIAELTERAEKAEAERDKLLDETAACISIGSFAVHGTVKAIAYLQEQFLACDQHLALADKDRAELDADLARLRDLTGVSITVGGGLSVFGTIEAIGRVQSYILLDSRHPIEAEDTRRSLARALQAAEAKLARLRAEGTFQARVEPWMLECFNAEIAADRVERCDRFLEEALELCQSLDWPRERAHALVEYVYGRDQGEVNQEVGGVMVTLAALCLAVGVDMHASGETELERINRPEIIKKIRAKQAAKPKGSALPIAMAVSRAEGTFNQGIEAAAREAVRYAEDKRRRIPDAGDHAVLWLTQAEATAAAIRALRKPETEATSLSSPVHEREG